MKFLEEATLKNPVFQIVVLAKASVIRSFIFWGFFTKLFFIHPFPPCLYFPSLCCLTSVKSCTVAIFHLTLCQNDTQLFCPSLPLGLLYKLLSSWLENPPSFLPGCLFPFSFSTQSNELFSSYLLSHQAF